MADEHQQAGNSAQAEHPDPITPTAMITLSRAAGYGQAPPWPASMIGATETELTRWCQLWSDSRALFWAQPEQEVAVATVVRLEQRASRRRRSLTAEVELDRLRRDLGLTE